MTQYTEGYSVYDKGGVQKSLQINLGKNKVGSLLHTTDKNKLHMD